jgi:hypothetical protein
LSCKKHSEKTSKLQAKLLQRNFFVSGNSSLGKLKKIELQVLGTHVCLFFFFEIKSFISKTVQIDELAILNLENSPENESSICSDCSIHFWHGREKKVGPGIVYEHVSKLINNLNRDHHDHH